MPLSARTPDRRHNRKLTLPSHGTGEMEMAQPTDGDLLSVLTDAVALVHAQEVIYP